MALSVRLLAGALSGQTLPVGLGLEKMLLVYGFEVDLPVLIDDVEVDGDDLVSSGGDARTTFAFLLF